MTTKEEQMREVLTNLKALNTRRKLPSDGRGVYLGDGLNNSVRCQDLIDITQAALNSLDAGKSVPEGYAIVPIVPTTEMLNAVANHKFINDEEDVYRAMLAAAPQPPEADTVRELIEAAIKTLNENLHLADGDVCTLKDLRDAVEKINPAWQIEQANVSMINRTADI